MYKRQGLHRVWKRYTLTVANPQPGQQVLDLAAFRDALMLHTMCTLQDTSIATGRTADSATADPDDLPALPWLAQGVAA